MAGNRDSALAALRVRDFRLYWFGMTLSRLGTAMQVMAIAWHIYLLTREPLSLGLIGLVQVGPVMAFSLLGGAWADAMSRRRLILVTQGALLVLSATLAAITFNGVATAWMLYVIIFLQAIASSAGGGAQAAIVPSLVPRELIPNAIAIKNLSWSVAGIAGPALGGLFIAHLGLQSVYLCDAVSFLAVVAAVLAARANLDTVETLAGNSVRASLAAIRDGFAFMRGNPVLLNLIMLDFVAVIFGEARTLLPVFAKDILMVGPEGLGLLAGAPAVGAAIGAGLLTFLRPPRWPGRVILLSILVYGLCTVVFGASHWFWLSWVALLGGGVADTISMTQRQVIPQIIATEAMRGRVSGINLFFANTGNQLGEFEAGAVAHWLGARASVVCGGLVCVLLALGVSWRGRTMWDFTIESVPEAAPVTP
ncbi:MAG: MFS transporter [Candidatus Sericytochromatia bacterium]|nr:MFS transporter [Candidatus Sericytochromatia bacterium]